MATAMEPKPRTVTMVYGGCASALAGVGLDDASDDVALDELALLLGSLSKRSSGETVEVAHCAGGRLVEEPDSVDLGLLGRITAGPSTLEFFHNTPSGDEFAGCLIKHGEFRHFLSLRKAPPAIPTQWVISSGRPESGIEGLSLRPMNGWPSGMYEGPPLLWTRLVVVSELPVTPDTLLLADYEAASFVEAHGNSARRSRCSAFRSRARSPA
jgi:hypothetical protein